MAPTPVLQQEIVVAGVAGQPKMATTKAEALQERIPRWTWHCEQRTRRHLGHEHQTAVAVVVIAAAAVLLEVSLAGRAVAAVLLELTLAG